MKKDFTNISIGDCVKISYVNDNDKTYTKIAKITNLSSKEISFETFDSKYTCDKNEITEIKRLDTELVTKEDAKRYKKLGVANITFLDGDKEVSEKVMIKFIEDYFILVSTEDADYQLSYDEIIKITNTTSTHHSSNKNIDIDMLYKLKQLKDDGIITASEFDKAKEDALSTPVNNASTDTFACGEAYKNFWSNYFTLKGRATRAEYWWPFLVNQIILAILFCLAPIISNVPCIVFFIAMMCPAFNVYVRRFHDLGKSGIFALFPLFLGIFLAVILGLPLAQKELFTGEFYTFWISIRFFVVLMSLILPVWIYIFPALPSQQKDNKYGFLK